MLTEAIGRKCSQGEKVCKTPSTAYLTLSENEAYALRSPPLEGGKGRLRKGRKLLDTNVYWLNLLRVPWHSLFSFITLISRQIYDKIKLFIAFFQKIPNLFHLSCVLKVSTQKSNSEFGLKGEKSVQESNR